MATRPAIPAPRPLSPRAAAYVRSVHAAEAERQRDIQDLVSKALAASVPARPVAKADKPPQVAVYDADGNLVGVTDPDSITPVAAAQSPEKPKAEAPPKDMTPAQPAAAAAPAAEVTKARADQAVAQLKKSLVGGGPAGSATEAAQAAETLNRALISRFEDMQRRGLAPGQPRTR